jgi:DNA-binding MltR family transcriptional regulator
MTTSQPTKSLRQLLESLRVSAEELGRQTHAGFAMIIAAALDRLLEEALTTKMVKLNSEMRSKLFGEFGALRDFSSKITLAHSLGVADDQCYKSLTMIRRVRNLFAHNEGYLGFDSPEVSALIAKELGESSAATSVESFVEIAEAVESYVTSACQLPHTGLIARLNADR